MSRNAWVSTSSDLTCRGDVIPVRCHLRERASFVVIDLGPATLFVDDLEMLGKLAVAVAEAQDLLAAALAGQDPLPVVADDPPAALVGQDRLPVAGMAVTA